VLKWKQKCRRRKRKHEGEAGRVGKREDIKEKLEGKAGSVRWKRKLVEEGKLVVEREVGKNSDLFMYNRSENYMSASAKKTQGIEKYTI
jgi:hypothetical protein